MEPIRPTFGGALRGSSPRALAALVVIAAFVGLVAWLVLDAGRTIDQLGSRRADGLASRSDGADAAGSVPNAFRSFRATLRPGERFALVFAPGTSIDFQGTYRLVSLSYLYPAIAVGEPEKAQAVMVFGEPSPAIRSAFAETGVVEGVWLGHR
jgi:hypothetical protein